MKHVLILWLWQQWQKYVEYFQKHKYQITWCCKTWKTKKCIEQKYGIWVITSLEPFMNLNTFDIVLVALPPEVQWQYAISILERAYKNKMIIEIPVTWNNTELKKLKEYKNVFFFLEEYFTLLSKFLRKADISKISKVHVTVYSSQQDYENLEARAVSYIHVNNNFIWHKDLDVEYVFYSHERADIFYEINLSYKGIDIVYYFNTTKYLLIWWKKFYDTYNFDSVVSQIINLESNINETDNDSL